MSPAFAPARWEAGLSLQCDGGFYGNFFATLKTGTAVGSLRRIPIELGGPKEAGPIPVTDRGLK